MTYTSSRKRSRSCEQDVCEFSPISKRINNIHIRSNGTKIVNNPEGKSCEEKDLHDVNGCIVTNGCLASHQVDHFSNGIHYQRLNYMNNPNDPQQPSFSGHNQQELANGHASTINAYNVTNSLPNGNNQWMGEGTSTTPLPFEPELSERENPIYYHVNEMLYQLHVERMRRLSK